MLLANGEIRGVDVNFTSPQDTLHPVKSFWHCSFQMAYPKVMFVNCTMNMPRGVLNVTQREKIGTNDENAALRIVDPASVMDEDWDTYRPSEWMAERGVEPGPIDPSEWVMVMGQTFEFCAFPVYIFGRGCEITYQAPANIETLKYSYQEWRTIEDGIGYERLAQLNREGKLMDNGQRPNRAERRRLERVTNR